MARRCSPAGEPEAAINLPSATKELSGTPTPVDPAGNFRKSSRILRSAEFRQVYDQGVRVPGPLFAAFCLARSEERAEGPRLGLTVPRAIGGAVDRNRIKRRLREAFRLHRSELQRKWDIVLNPRRAVLRASFADIEGALLQVIRTCNER